MSSRTILKSQVQRQAEIADLLQSMFALELIAPSRSIWIVSPWISDIQLLDNRAGEFATVVDPTWGERWITLSEVLARLLRTGTHLQLGIRVQHEYTDSFVERLNALAARDGGTDRLTVTRDAELHLKGVLADRWYLAGSMNLTTNGVQILEEGVRYTTVESEVAEARIDYHARWGGILPTLP
jgi:hypothetical protein